MNGVEKKRVRITQEDCDCARFLMRKGYSIKTIAQTLKVDASTVSKIKGADFRLERYLENRKASNKLTAENKKKAAEEVIDYTKAPIEGQMEMDLTPAKTEKKTEGDWRKDFVQSENARMMRFLAAQADEIVKALNAITEELKRLNGGGNDGGET